MHLPLPIRLGPVTRARSTANVNVNANAKANTTVPVKIQELTVVQDSPIPHPSGTIPTYTVTGAPLTLEFEKLLLRAPRAARRQRHLHCSGSSGVGGAVLVHAPLERYGIARSDPGCCAASWKAGNAEGHAIQEEWMGVMEWRISGLCSYREIPGEGCDKMIKERIPHG